MVKRRCARRFLGGALVRLMRARRVLPIETCSLVVMVVSLAVRPFVSMSLHSHTPNAGPAFPEEVHNVPAARLQIPVGSPGIHNWI